MTSGVNFSTEICFSFRCAKERVQLFIDIADLIAAAVYVCKKY